MVAEEDDEEEEKDEKKERVDNSNSRFSRLISSLSFSVHGFLELSFSLTS